MEAAGAASLRPFRVSPFLQGVPVPRRYNTNPPAPDNPQQHTPSTALQTPVSAVDWRVPGAGPFPWHPPRPKGRGFLCRGYDAPYREHWMFSDLPGAASHTDGTTHRQQMGRNQMLL